MPQPIAVALLLLFASVEEPAPVVRGRLCLGDRKAPLTACSDVTGTKLTIASADAERLFVWTSTDATTVHVGVVPAKEETIDLSPTDKTSAMQLSLDGERSRGWPANVAVSLMSNVRWRWLVDAKSAPRLRRIVVPRGTYAIEMRSEHHRRFVRAQIAANEPTVALGELRLLPLPMARGMVLDSEDKALANAVVSRPDGSICATANEQGAFECELGEPTPEALVVSKSGFGPRELRLERGLDKDVDLGKITLTSGRTLTLKIVRPEATAASVTLFHDAEQRYEHSKLKTHELREREEEVRFDVGEGKYIALVAGDGPLERLEVPITVKDADATETITVVPYQLAGSVRFGEELVAEDTAEVVAPEHTWRATIPIRAGAFGGTAWQTGKVSAFILQELVRSPELGADPTRWDVRIEKRLITGRVLDAETKRPVPEAHIDLTAETKGSRAHMAIKVKRDGSYEVLANRPGTYGLRVTSEEHVAQSVDVNITDEDRVRKVDIALERGVLQQLQIVTPRGAPVPNATILEGVQSDRNNPRFITHADGRGNYELRGRAGETRLLYIVPGDGSFAVLRAQIPRRDEDARPLQVIVPPGSSSLRVRAATNDGEPIAARVLIRYNGEFVPGAILRFVTHEFVGTNPAGEAVLSRLPSGTYEVWGLAGERDEEALIASNGALRSPVRTGLSGGEQAVQVVAPPREVRRAP